MTFDRDRFHVLNVFSERVTSGDVGLTRQENISVASGGAPCQRISSNQSRDNNQRGRGTNQPQHAIKNSANPRDQQDRPPEAQKPGSAAQQIHQDHAGNQQARANQTRQPQQTKVRSNEASSKLARLSCKK